MTIDEMKQKKIEFGYTYNQIALLSGLPVGTVQKVLGGITKAPRYETLKALEAVFAPSKQADMICEPETAYKLDIEKEPGNYTVEDYFAWPEDERIELIDGVIYDMTAPTDLHQIIAGRIYWALMDYILKNKGKCISVMSPIDVQLNKDDKTIVQPDVLIVCDRDKFQNGRIFGAPDFVVEVLSSSTRKKDMQIKQHKYMEAGVKEYWMVDPKSKRVIVHTNLNDYPDIAVYTFDDIVPVQLYDGKCEMNFKEIYEYVSFLYKE